MPLCDDAPLFLNGSHSYHVTGSAWINNKFPRIPVLSIFLLCIMQYKSAIEELKTFLKCHILLSCLMNASLKSRLNFPSVNLLNAISPCRLNLAEFKAPLLADIISPNCQGFHWASNGSLPPRKKPLAILLPHFTSFLEIRHITTI